jgi:hypothetical protein
MQSNRSIISSPRINYLLLIDITIIVYLTVFVSGFSSLDDTGLMEALQKGGLTFGSLAHSHGSTYVRPIAMLTYLVDYTIWGANAGAFHGTNLLIHLINALLVYNLCRKYLPEAATRETISLSAALFFAVNPVNTESVLWISGRTDLLCAFFFLIAIRVLVSETLSPLAAFAGLALATFGALLSKESAIALLGIVPLYLLLSGRGKNWQMKVSLCSAVCCATLLYFFLRTGNVATLDNGSTKIIASVADKSFADLVSGSVAALGFYSKKMFWPFPLNLAIQSINEPLYLIVGIAVIVAAAACFIRYSGTRLPILIIFLCLVPPLLALHGKIPWTLYAERYVYLSMTGLAMLVGVFIANLPRLPQLVPFIVIASLALTTIYRSGQWADPLLLWEDTVRKSPDFSQPYAVYAYELIQVGRFADAEKNVNKALSMKLENELVGKCVASIREEKQRCRPDAQR